MDGAKSITDTEGELKSFAVGRHTGGAEAFPQGEVDLPVKRILAVVRS